jgi:hypothetical protein
LSRTDESTLETAARDAGIVADPDSVDPVGSYARRHENGLHQLCIGPARTSGRNFGMIAELGEGLLCEGTGRVTARADRLVFVFDHHAQCRIEALYDGERIRLSGKIPSQCADLCSSRATFAGLSVLRSGWTRQDALHVRARRADEGIAAGDPLCS